MFAEIQTPVSLETKTKDLLRPSQSYDSMTFHRIKSMIKPEEL